MKVRSGFVSNSSSSSFIIGPGDRKHPAERFEFDFEDFKSLIPEFYRVSDSDDTYVEPRILDADYIQEFRDNAEEYTEDLAEIDTIVKDNKKAVFFNLSYHDSGLKQLFTQLVDRKVINVLKYFD